MAVSVEWEIKGTEFANCNCIYACPCQFNALPDKGFCEAVAGFQIHQGHLGDVALDGLRAAAIWHWPGAVHERQRQHATHHRRARRRKPARRAGQDFIGTRNRGHGHDVVGVRRNEPDQARAPVPSDRLRRRRRRAPRRLDVPGVVP